MADVLGHTWMRGECVTKEYFVTKLQNDMNIAMSDAVNQDEMDIDFSIIPATREGQRGEGDSLFDDNYVKSHQFKLYAKLLQGQQCAAFTVLGKPLELMAAVHGCISATDPDLAVSDKNWRITYTCKLKQETTDGTEEENKEENKDDEDEEAKEDDAEERNSGPRAKIQCDLHELEKDKKYRVVLLRKEGAALAFT